MANVWIRSNGKTYRFSIWPVDFLLTGVWRDLTGSAVKLFDFLLFLASVSRSFRLDVSNQEIEDYCGLCTETIGRARKELANSGLVIVEQGKHSLNRFTLCAPDAPGKPLQTPGIKQDKLRSPRPLASTRERRRLRGQPQTEASRRAQHASKQRWARLKDDAENPEARLRKTRIHHSENPDVDPAQVVETSPRGTIPITNSNRKEISRAGFILPSWDSIGENTDALTFDDGPFPPDPDDDGDRAGEITNALAEHPAVRRLVEKFNAKIVGVVNHRTGEELGYVSKSGVPFDVWDREQRKNSRGGFILTPEEALAKYGDPAHVQQALRATRV